jgi:hypothetical protein
MTILQQVGYSEVVGVRQVGKSASSIARLALAKLHTALGASRPCTMWAGG